MTRLMSICIMFANYTNRFGQTLEVDTELALDDLEDLDDKKSTKTRATKIEMRIKVAVILGAMSLQFLVRLHQNKPQN
jgi:hypothetical protein